MSIPKGKDKNRLLFGRPFITWSWAPEQVFADDVPVITHPQNEWSTIDFLEIRCKGTKIPRNHQTIYQIFIILIFCKFLKSSNLSF